MITLLTFQSADAPLDSIDDLVTSAINLDAHLNVLMVGLAIFTPVSVYAEAQTYDWSQSYTQLIRDTHTKSNELSAYLKKSGVEATVIPVCDGLGAIPGIAADNALVADFAIVPTASPMMAALRKAFLDGVMFNASTPTILLPPDTVMSNRLERVVIGWHPSPNTASAVRSSLPLLNTTTEVDVCVVDSTPGIYGHTPASDIATFLARHSIQTNVELMSSNDKLIGELLIQRALDVNADLLVMGAYGRSRFREWLLGGTTRDVLESLAVPTLVQH